MTGLKVFLSSTYLDNADRRKTVEDAVSRLHMVPVGVERFIASDRPTVDECLRFVRESDVFVGILSRRYGCRFDWKSFMSPWTQ